MITPRLRPRTHHTIQIPPRILVERLRARLDDPECPCRGLVSEQQIDLRIREQDRLFWSPQLTVHLSAADDEKATHLTGHFGPNANVWTMFLAAYGFVVLSGIGGVFYGLSQMMLDRTPWALLSIPVTLVLVLLIYLAAGWGQKLGLEQVDVLKNFIDAAVSDE